MELVRGGGLGWRITAVSEGRITAVSEGSKTMLAIVLLPSPDPKAAGRAGVY